MKRIMRVAGVLSAGAALAVIAMPSATYAASGSQSSGSTQTQHRATETFVDLVPCASDEGFFEVTITYNSVERFADDRGHFTQTGTFRALPVTVTAFEEETHDGHVHLIPVAWEPRDGDIYSGRFTTSGTFNDNRNATSEKFNFRLKGDSTGGDRVSAHGLFHRVTSNGAEHSLLERETCRG